MATDTTAHLVAALDSTGTGTFTITAPWGLVETFKGESVSGPISLRHAGYIVCGDEIEMGDRVIWSVAKA